MLNLINQLQNDNIESNNLVEAERNSHLEKELNYNALLTRSEEKVNCYKEKFRNLCRDDGKRGPTKSKSYGDLSRSQQQFRIKKDISMKPLESSQPDLEELHTKFTGDGTFVGKRLHVVNFGYTILNEKRKAMSDRGNYSLAIVKIKEDYESIRDALSDLVTEMKSMVSAYR